MTKTNETIATTPPEEVVENLLTEERRADLKVRLAGLKSALDTVEANMVSKIIEHEPKTLPEAGQSMSLETIHKILETLLVASNIVGETSNIKRELAEKNEENLMKISNILSRLLDEII